VRRRIAVFVTIIQSVLFLGHAFLYETLVAFWRPGQASVWKIQVTLAVLSVSFVGASLLAFRFANLLVRMFYTLAAMWLGVFSFCFYAACLCWGVSGVAALLGLHPHRQSVAAVIFGAALLVSAYGIVNAALLRVKRVTVKLPNLPESWRGRVAALVSDTHLGHVRNRGFIRRIVAKLGQLAPDIVFIAGDLYDGTAADVKGLAEPLGKLCPPLGTYFVAGNHEEFSDHTKYLEAVRGAGVRVLNNEKVMVDGLQLVGVHYRDGTRPERLRPILRRAAVAHERTSILLNHGPYLLEVAEEEGISLQLSGHTHGGQFFPYTRIVSRIYGAYAYGLQRFGNMMVYTSCGAGTWGPPLRVGTSPEIVLIRFE